MPGGGGAREGDRRPRVSVRESGSWRWLWQMRGGRRAGFRTIIRNTCRLGRPRPAHSPPPVLPRQVRTKTQPTHRCYFHVGPVLTVATERTNLRLKSILRTQGIRSDTCISSRYCDASTSTALHACQAACCSVCPHVVVSSKEHVFLRLTGPSPLY